MTRTFVLHGRGWFWLLIFAFLSRGATALGAQALDATKLGEAVRLENAPWRVAFGDRPEWKDPAFDDSRWAARIPAQPPKPLVPCKPFCWFRLAVAVAPSAGNLSIGLNNVDTSYEVFVNGEKVGGHGGMPPQASNYVSNLTLYPIPQAAIATGKLLIAIRLWVSPLTPGGESPGGMNTGSVILIGRTADAELWREQDVATTIYQMLPRMLNGFLGLVVGLPALMLFRLQRDRREYIWLAAQGVCLAGATAADLLASFDLLSMPWVQVLGFGSIIGYLVCNIEFIFAFLERPVNRYFRVTEWLLAFAFLIQSLDVRHIIPLVVGQAAFAVLSIPVNLGIPILLISAWRRGNREAGLLLIPIFFLELSNYAYVIWNLVFLAFGSGHLKPIPLLHIGPVTVNIATMFAWFTWMTLGLIILRRNSEIVRERSRAAAELQAAKTVQDVLMPRLDMLTPGFNLQSAYQPAQEVGGDFFHVLPMNDGALRLVIGDVSGKGLKAAMTVALIVGALDRERSGNPTEVLESLNRTLLRHSTGGFATCLCVHITAQGTLTTANAGHFMPYRNGVELEMEANLPLGLAADTAYAEASWTVHPGDRLVCFTDGVPEARHHTSGELFGFERTRELIESAVPAEQIVEAAQDFGQDDDITVVELEVAVAVA